MRGRNKNPHDSRRFNDWIENSAADLKAAKLLIGEERCLKLCAFHLQQCIEKGLKAYVLVNDGRLLDGHNLTWLCKQAMKKDASFEQWLDESVSLNKYYIETRYPSDIKEEITRPLVERLLNMTSDMFKYICYDIGYYDEELC
ncbi:MAG: HEPN domain-containing protein [Oscillospiraceae bacterium]|nr:HEPN domain-containing protein [Oscillospiraceae bacterium]